MKILKERIKLKFIKKEENEIILEDDDKIIISSLKRNKIKIIISCKDGAIEIDTIPIEDIENLKKERNAMKAMKQYITGKKKRKSKKK